MSNKRTQIIEASIDLFATSGFWNTPTSKITKHAGVSTGTLFNYFDSKDLLIDAVYLQLKQEQAAHMAINFPYNASVKERFEHLWFRYIDWGLNQPVRYHLLRQMKLSDLISSEAQASYDAELEAMKAQMLPEGMENGPFKEIEADYLGMLLYAQLEAAVNHALTHQLTEMSLSRHISHSFQIFWDGVSE